MPKHRVWRGSQRASGLRVDCAQPAEDGRTRCRPCLDANARRARDVRGAGVGRRECPACCADMRESCEFCGYGADTDDDHALDLTEVLR